MLRLQYFGVLRTVLTRSRFFQRPLESLRRAHGTSKDLFLGNLDRDTTLEELRHASFAANRNHITLRIETMLPLPFDLRKKEIGNVGSRTCATSKT